LKSKFGLIIYIVLFTCSNFISINHIKSGENEFPNIINSDYLRKEPETEYIIDSGDVLRIDISPNYQELASINTVNGEGVINLKYIGNVYVRGLTIKELNFILNEEYSDYVKYPKVESVIASYRPIKILIEGEVNNPGLITLKGSITLNSSQDTNLLIQSQTKTFGASNFNLPIIEELPMINDINFYFPTVFDAIRSSGGITEYADLSKIKIIRKNTLSKGGGAIEATVNFDNFSNIGNAASQNIRILDGDQIVIPKNLNPDQKPILNAIRANLNPKFINVFVTGKVNSPGQKTIGKSTTLNDAIDIAGGAKVLKGPIKYLTFVNDGSVKKTNIKYRKNTKRGSKNNPYLKNGDLIFVGTSFFSNTASIINEITSPFQGIYSTYRLIELFND
tara:strand:- start:1219 stop:2394 length:1176 start_codon:yes stop_codon:yes gene_type:complete